MGAVNMQTGLVNPDFAADAESCGGVGLRVTTRAELAPAFAAAMAVTGKPTLVEVHSSAQAV
jgi:thiamine pyrophosphate-dependent acetolactate synthase large subunit-like protein